MRAACRLVFGVCLAWMVSISVCAKSAGLDPAVGVSAVVSVSAPAPAPALDVRIQHYSKLVTAEGVVREARYAEHMVRRPQHVWLTRDLPSSRLANTRPHDHTSFNPVLLARHVYLDGAQVQLSFVDLHEREIIHVAETDFENVDLDANWERHFHLIDLRELASLPRSTRTSPLRGAVWHERETQGMFLRVLWDPARQIVRVWEQGARDGSVYRRFEVTPVTQLQDALPWLQLDAFVQKDYVDFLD